MRIRQMICGLGHFKDRISKKYGFVAYQNSDEPAIAFGVYNQSTIDKILRSNAMIIVVWSGTDAYDFCYRPKFLNWDGLTQKKNVRHVAISRWISHDLSMKGVPHICLPVNAATITADLFKPVPLGTKIFSYSFKIRPNLYGRNIIDAVKKRLPDIEFIDIISSDNVLPYIPNEMPQIYGQCFMGLRPTIHDGCSNTVIELGLMGRRCIHNGQLPGSIPWYGVDDIVKTIREEQKKIGTTDELLALRTKKYIDVPEDWLDTEFWK